MLPLMPPGAPPGAPLPGPPMGAPPKPPPPGMGGGPIPLPPPPAALAGMAAAQLVPEQVAQQEALQRQQTQELLGLLTQQLASAPNPAAEAAQGMPAAMVSPDNAPPSGSASGDPNALY